MTIPTTHTNPASVSDWRLLQGQNHQHIVTHGTRIETDGSAQGDVQANKATIENLMTALHHAFPDYAGDAMAILQEAWDKGAPLSSRLVERALHSAEHSAAHLLDKYDQHPESLLPQSPRGAQLIQDVNGLITHRRSAEGVNSLAGMLPLLNNMLTEIESAPSVGDCIKDRMSSIVRTRAEQITFAQLSKTVPQLQPLSSPSVNAYRFVVDGKMQDKAEKAFVFDNELGYLAAALNAWNHMLTTLDTGSNVSGSRQPLTADLFQELHDKAVAGVHNRGVYDRDNMMEQGYREGAVYFRLISSSDGNATEAGLQEFADSAKNNGGWISIEPTDLDDVGLLRTSRKSPQECRQKAAEIIETYHQALAVAKQTDDNILGAGAREGAILRTIAVCCQDLEQHHLFSDGNIRTVGFMVMNKLLLEEGLDPVIMHDPNQLDMHSVNEVVDLIRVGQANFRQYCEQPE